MTMFLKLAGLVILFTGLILVPETSAQERSDTGRHKPVAKITNADDLVFPAQNDSSPWTIEINGGMLGGDDIFRASHASGDTIDWVPGDSDDWVSNRIKVRLENSIGTGFQIQRRMGNWYSLRAGAYYSRMDLVADAPIVETAEVFPYDQADMWLFNIGAEVRLTILTESYPYVTGDLVFVDFAPQEHDFLSQSNLGGRVGFGFHHQFDPIWAINLEIGLSRSALTSIYFPTPEGADPEDIEYENEDHLTLFDAKFGIRLKI